ncbi:MAG: hypothetical protein OXF24_04310 [Hyphomicrobiales bacterium]|nr:hypothetical protein [Hyphomicrobiales bacterium]
MSKFLLNAFPAQMDLPAQTSRAAIAPEGKWKPPDEDGKADE